MREQGRHILAAIAQGRKLQVNYVQAVVKILAKPAFAYKGEEIGIYVFRDEQTNQPVITSIWKRPRGGQPGTRR